MTSLLAFAVAIAILVAVHEFGHFWVARRLGVRVLRFSVGFGRPLLSRTGRDGTEYCLSVVPLGGYVKMLDEREGEVSPQDLPYAFNRQSVWSRMAIVLAGPAANFVLAIFFYWLVFCLGVTGVRPLVGDPVAGTPAADAGLKAGDEIVAVHGESTPTWDQVSLRLVEGVLDQVAIPVTVLDEEGSQRMLFLAVPDGALDEPNALLRHLGLTPYAPVLPPVLGALVGDGPAERAGLKPDDRIVSVDGETVSSWGAWVEAVRDRPDRMVEVRVLRAGEEQDFRVFTASRQQGDRQIGFIGAAPHVPSSLRERMSAEYRYGPLEAIPQAVERTWDMSTLTLRMLWKMVQGRVGLENLSGPINIAQYAGQSATIGITAFLSFLAVVSVSLGVLNLLPIPVLDGGHFLFYVVEVLKGKPLSEHAQLIGQQVGVFLLVALMGLAFYNDIMRLLG
ncbi:MAG: RIP metalloprotease RseP [Pseudomonadota bacterium]|nr:RIP metalloprotease RseP [Pseudomonadota bacterium]